ncbi:MULTISPECIES: acyl carrier protein [Streptomyces]|uniref:Acyl carrier protein n=1 Tax=Streptomyces hirsutus TaxID=35620 RepID=A0ABZ1GLR3_9ACTN|nr:acyl carrier protein [Streptomyces hirsutus]WSD06231.1 acyl carrier protein [Streptomyces hirsutus]WTD20344.1 acyl carrier protein [Streptomyces hirsutus]WTD74732.1 acyl carrier protein [Streptomyces sp. NBC_01635]
MSDMTLSELGDLLLECVGAPEEGMALEGEQALDTPFLEFGYDSLALLQVTSVINRKYGIVLDDDAVAEAETPRMLLRMIGVAPHAGAVR